MANIQHLIAALGKVADAYAPYARDPNDDPDSRDDPNDDPDDSDKDPNDDPGNDDGDPLDDPRSYPDDDDDPDKDDEDDEDDEDDFSKPPVFNTVMLLERLELEQMDWQDRQVVARQTTPAPTKLQQKNVQLSQIRRKAADAERELQSYWTQIPV
jgi:hypothetical protein